MPRLFIKSGYVSLENFILYIISVARTLTQIICSASISALK